MLPFWNRTFGVIRYFDQLWFSLQSSEGLDVETLFYMPYNQASWETFVYPVMYQIHTMKWLSSIQLSKAWEDTSMDYLSGMFSVFVFGMVVALLGTVKLKLTPKIGADDAQFGKLVAILQFSMVIFAIVAGVLLDITGFKTIIILGFVITAIAFLVDQPKRMVCGSCSDSAGYWRSVCQ